MSGVKCQMSSNIYFPEQTIEQSLWQVLLSSPIFIVAVFLVIVAAAMLIALFLYRAYVRKHYKLPARAMPVVLMIKLPKEPLQQAEQKNKDGISDIHEQISWAENLWQQIGGLKPQKGFKSWLYSRWDYLSLEIVVQDGMIAFYCVLPKNLKNYFIEQLEAHYPHAQVEEVADYNLFEPDSTVSAASLKLSSVSMFPIKTYKYFETDPLNSITNSLSKIDKKDGAVIQIMIRPAEKAWRAQGMKVASTMQQGKSLKDALREVGGSNLLARAQNLYKDVMIQENKDAAEASQNFYRLSPKEEEVVKNIEDKVAKAGLEVQLRVVTASKDVMASEMYLKNILNSFSQFNIYEYGNGFEVAKAIKVDKVISDYIHRRFGTANKFVLNTEELASVFHFPLPSCETPNINWLGSRKAAPPANLPQDGVVLGVNEYRGKESLVRIKQEDRMRHFYIVGMTGTGKSKLMVNMAVQDIEAGRGVCYIDPHGQEVEEILANIPENRAEDVYYFDPSDAERPIGLNMLEAGTSQEADFAAQEMITIFYKLLPDPSMAGPMFEHYMRNALLLLMADPQNPGTLVELPRIFTDESFRAEKLKYTNDMMVKDFWQREFAASQKGSMAADMLSYVISKTGRFVENAMMRNIIGQPHSGFNFRKIMDEGKILLVNLSKGKVGEVNSDLLGLILVSKLQMAAMARADMSESKRKDFMLYIDEFQNYVTDSMAIILAEARKYRLSLTMAHQYIGQLSRGQDVSIKDAVFGNVGSLAVFRIGPEDAEFLAKQYAPVFNEFDLVNIEKFKAYVRLLIDNQSARPFNMSTLPPNPGELKLAEALKNYSRERFGRSQAEVEQQIKKRSKIGELGGENKE